MKHLLAAVCAIALIPAAGCTKPVAACSNPVVVKEVKGYPVYKFLNFGGIDAKTLKARKFLGEGYDAYVEQHELLVSHGFDLHTPLKIQIESGKVIEVYVRNKDYDELWKVSPHDLAKHKKSHLVTIKFIRVKVGDKSVNRAVSFQADLVERYPVLVK